MERHAALGWFINDLSRAAIPYHFIRIFAKLARLHHFVQYDAPVSVARAFVVEDWQALCAAAGLAAQDVSIQTGQARSFMRGAEKTAMTITPSTVDHLVIGGGPAGSMVAIRLAAAGRDVVLIERERAAHHKVCGEFLSRRSHALSCISSASICAVSARNSSARFASPRATRSSPRKSRFRRCRSLVALSMRLCSACPASWMPRAARRRRRIAHSQRKHSAQ